MKIGLTLSGGGFRALVFHLGALARLAEENQLENVTYVSTVSGGSLAIGLIFAQNNFNWPSSQDYINILLPKLQNQVTTNGLKQPLILRQLRKIFTIFDTRADDVAVLLEKRWNITISLDQLPDTPRWMINATCYETGKNWRFERFRMGDYIFGYTNDTKYPLSHAMAASAAFPGLIGPLVLATDGYSWFQYIDNGEESGSTELPQKRKTKTIKPEFKHVHLWDGGVYDNLGLEGLHDFRKGWPKLDFLLVSDASGRFKSAGYRTEVSALLRMVSGIMKNQIRSLQSRTVMERVLDHHDRGSYLRTGNNCEKILREAWEEKLVKDPKLNEEISKLCKNSLTEEEAAYCADLPTDIENLTTKDYKLLLQHGFEVANATLYGYNDDLFTSFNYPHY